MVLRRRRSSDTAIQHDEGPAGRSLRRWRRGALLAGGVAFGLAVPQIAGAISSPYPDVPTDHPFVSDIAWAKNVGLVEGYSDGNYRPGNPVTRGSMTAFLHRLYNTQEVSGTAVSFDAASTSNVTWTHLSGSLTTITTPENVPVVVHVLFTTESSCTGPSGLWCQVQLLVDPPGPTGWTTMAPTGADLAFDDAETVARFNTQSLQGLYANGGAGEYKVQVQYRVLSPADEIRLDDWMLRVDTDLLSS